MKNPMKCEAENLIVKTAPDGAVSELFIKGSLFSGFPGRIAVSPGIAVSAAWSSKGTHLACELELRRFAGSPEDGASASFRVPYQAMQYNLKVWTARKGYPKDIWDMGGRRVFYGDLCHGTMIPAVTLYDPVTDAGLTVAKEPGRTGGRLSFRFDDYHGEGMYVELSCLKVTADSPVKLTLLFRAHAGCWRPGLGWYLEEHRQFFEPEISDVRACRAFAITNAFTDPAWLGKYRPDWVEIHNHFPNYGEYLPEEESWTSVIAHDYPEIAAERSLTITREMMHKHMAALHREHIRAMYYFQCSGDGFIPWAEKNFPDAVARDSAGHMIPTWKDCVMLNADPETSFGKFVQARLGRLLEVYPEIDGVFADQVCYQTIDWAHADGRTACGGRDGYEYGLSIEKNLKLLAELMHSRGKPVLGNGPFDMECARYLDAVMCEGTGGNFESLKYLCLHKVLLIHAYPFQPRTAEQIMRGCILSGAGWSLGGSSTLTDPEWTGEVRAVYDAYLPLAQAVFGAEILLTPDPVRADPPDTVKTEIFRSREKDAYLLGAVCERDTLAPETRLSVKLPEPCAQAEILKAGEKCWHPLEFKEENGRLLITLSSGMHACVVRFRGK